MSIALLDIMMRNAINMAFDDSLSPTELLSAVVAKVNEMATALNVYLETDISAVVEARLAAWETDGTLEDLINSAMQTEIDDLTIEVDANTAAAASLLTRITDMTDNVKKHGAVGDDSTDDTAAIQAAIDANIGKTIFIPKATYKLTAGLDVKCNIISDGAVLKFYGITIAKLLNQEVQASLSGFTIDGDNVTNCQYGLFVDTDFLQNDFCKYDLVIKNIKNGSNLTGANGAVFFKDSGASVNLNSRLDIKIQVENVTATANGVIGDNGGSSCGILVSFNGNGCDGTVIVRDSIVKNILPVEDSGGILVYQGDAAVAGAKGSVLIENCKVYNSKKRGFKIQAPNVTLDSCICYGEDTTIGFDTYAPRTTFRNCQYLAGIGQGFRLAGDYATLIDCKAELTGVFPGLVIETGSDNNTIRGLVVLSTATLASPAYSLINITASLNTILERVKANNSHDTGTAIILVGVDDLIFDGLDLSGTVDGFLMAYNTGKVEIRNSKIVCSNIGINRTGDTLIECKVINTLIEADSMGVYGRGTGVEIVLDMNACIVKADDQGVLAADGSKIRNTDVISTATTGYGIQAGNSVVRGNRITKYAVGISYTYTTTAEIANNVTIGSTASTENTGYTKFVEHDNDAR